MKEIILNNPQADIVETTAQRVLMHCGVGIGKSHCIGLISFDFIRNNPYVRGFIGANTYGQLGKSTLDRVFKVWENEFGLKREIHYVVDKQPKEGWKIYGPQLKTYENVISFSNGATIFIASLDNYKVIDGTEFGWACLDETKDTKEEAVKEVIVARLRQVGMLVDERGVIFNANKTQDRITEGRWKYITDDKGTHLINEYGKKMYGYNPLYIFTSPAKAKWISDWFKLDEDADEIIKSIFYKDRYYRKMKGNQLVVIASSYHNEHNLSHGYIDRLIEDLGGNKGLVDMLVYGSPFGKAGNEFYSAFDRMKHVKDVQIDNSLPIHISFDFNVVPYITMTCWQIIKTEKGFIAKCFDEFCLESPKNNIIALCQDFEAKYSSYLLNGLFYYGDYSGKAGNTISIEYKNHYDAVDKLLGRYLSNYSDRVIVNPFVAKRRVFINKILSGNSVIDIHIDKRCKNLIADLEFLQEGPDGGKLKKKIKDNQKGFSYEEHGHTSDSMDYFICSAFQGYFENLYF